MPPAAAHPPYAQAQTHTPPAGYSTQGVGHYQAGDPPQAGSHAVKHTPEGEKKAKGAFQRDPNLKAPPVGPGVSPIAAENFMVPRVVPEYREDVPGGPRVFATRIADFRAECEAGWKRFKCVGRAPGVLSMPSVYIVAPDREAAREAYLREQALDDYPEDVANKIMVFAKELPD